MNKIQYFGLGFLSISMLFISGLIIGTGRIIFGPDALIIAIMGWMFFNSIRAFIEAVKGLRLPSETITTDNKPCAKSLKGERK